MTRVLLVAGTRPPGDTPGPEDWWHPASAFAAALVAAGHQLADAADPYSWTQATDGVLGESRDWEEAANALRWYLDTHPADAIIAHSHGGNVVALALAALALARRPIKVHLVTVATPVRPELANAYATARFSTWRWTHLRSDGADRWQRWGTRTWSDWLRPWRWADFARDMAAADCNVYAPGVSHGGLLDPALWSARGWWDLLELSALLQQRREVPPRPLDLLGAERVPRGGERVDDLQQRAHDEEEDEDAVLAEIARQRLAEIRDRPERLISGDALRERLGRMGR